MFGSNQNTRKVDAEPLKQQLMLIPTTQHQFTLYIHVGMYRAPFVPKVLSIFSCNMVYNNLKTAVYTACLEL